MQKDLIYINIGTKGLVDASGNPIRSSTNYPSIERGQWQVLCINFVQVTEDAIGVVTVTPADISGNSYLFVADNNFDDDDNLMLKSYQSTIPFDQTNPESNRINIAGDWVDGSTADLTLGQMSIRIYSDTAKFVEALGSKQQVNTGLYANIKQYIQGLSAPSSVAWFPFIAKNTVRDWGDVQEVPPSGESLVPFIDAYLKQPTEYQFSADGETWHLGQTDDDLYYRQRVANIGVGWGESVKMIVGPEGEDGISPHIGSNSNWYIGDTDTGVKAEGVDGTSAGFGTPILNVTTGEPGTEASGTVTATGDNTAKVFTFNLTVPEGKKGTAAGFGSITARAETIPPEYQASATVSHGGTNESKTLDFRFQIPKGAKGDPMKIDATGTAAELAQYDAEAKGFSFLATDTGKVYIKASDSVGDWSDPVGFQGPAGSSAGFAAPVVSVTTLEPDKQATASVTASGADTAKTFTFEFGIPQGKQGEQGIPGKDGYIENFEVQVPSLTDGMMKLNVNAVPVIVRAPSGNYYPIEKTRLTGSVLSGWAIDPTPLLNYENMQVFGGDWSVFCAGAKPGEPGKDGTNFNPNAVGVLSERTLYDTASKGFSFFSTDNGGNIYVKNSNTSGDWSEAIPFRGPKGDTPDISIVDDKWVIDGTDTGKPSRGEPGPMAEVTISDGGNWVVNGVDTGKSARGKGANVILSPIQPSEPFEGMILVSAPDVSTTYFDLESLSVITGTTPPATAENGTIFIVEAE